MTTVHGNSIESIRHELLIGTKIKVTTTLKEEIEGYIYTIDALSRCILLQDQIASSNIKQNVNLIRENVIDKLEILEIANVETSNALPRISEDELLRMEARNDALAEQALSRIGKNVTTEAQEIFDALCKTMPCTWDGQSIVVIDEVILSPPYVTASCSTGNTQLLARVKKVLEGEKKKMSRAKNATNN